MTLENLVKISRLKREAADRREFEGLLKASVNRLNDGQNESLSHAGRFDLVYNAAHGFALAALRASGYRTDKRYLVFQCLAHVTNLTRVQIRLLSKCHEKRNLDVYEGLFEVDDQLLGELIQITQELKSIVERIKL